LILSGDTLYGTAHLGGSSGNGTVFKLNSDGTGFTTLHTFTTGFYGNNDGAAPYAGLILSGNTLYGTALYGGGSGRGTVFALNTEGTGFTTLHHFAGYPREGENPAAGLILSGNTLYGTTESGGRSFHGTVFAVNTDGTGFTTLHDFTAGSGSYPNEINSDGAYPAGGLILAGNTLYGTTELGGSSGDGTVFAIHIDGAGFTNLHNFDYSDGAYPVAGLVLSGKTLYGTTAGGGISGAGTLFKLFVNHAPSSVAKVAPLFAVSSAEISRFILSPGNADAAVVLDGSQSSDADGDSLQFAWFADGQTNPLVTGALAVHQFAVGSHTVQLVVDDGYDTAMAQVSFEVITPSASVAQLILLVGKSELGTVNKQPLLATLSAAMSSFDRGEMTGPINLLSTFQHKVRTQLAPSRPALASQFIAACNQIITIVIGAGLYPVGLEN
jgi:uncharacterized repeat protein (TIGR03803 family)